LVWDVSTASSANSISRIRISITFVLARIQAMLYCFPSAPCLPHSWQKHNEKASTKRSQQCRGQDAALFHAAIHRICLRCTETYCTACDCPRKRKSPFGAVLGTSNLLQEAKESAPTNRL
jgi:hypothetical protein